MMNEIFLKMLNMSLSGSWIIVAVMVLRILMKKAPKRFTVLLWGMVAVRLICPFSIESPLSLVPSGEIIPQNIFTGSSFDIHTGIAPIDQQINTYLGDHYFEGVTVLANNGFIMVSALSIVWMTGILIIGIYTVFSYWRLYHRLDTAVVLRDNIFQSENVDMPFVFGVIRPRIYLPYKLNGKSMKYIISHEQAHIRRGDHYWKFLGFLLVAVYWFNPLVWVAYVMLCRDIELACDEYVIKDFNNEQKADYSQTLVACSVRHSLLSVIPLAFGEIGVRKRIKSIMRYKKPVFGVILAAVAVCMITAVCFLSNPQQDHLIESGQNLKDALYTPYIGDAVKVSTIAQSLSYPDGYFYTSLELQTDAEPYEMIVYLRGHGDVRSEQFKQCAATAFDLIGNLGVFTVRSSENGLNMASFSSKDFR